MKTFQYIEPQFVPPVDLQTLNTAYSNLESMHQEAVKSSSELKNAIAQLQLNEREEGFRQQLVKSVEDTIDANMNHGNLAGAYDDIIKLSGDIVASPALIGRLKAQQDYLTYQAKVDSMNLPDDYKEYFKEMNPYHYEDTYDRNGNIIGGSKWNPIKTPTTIVNLADIADKALRRVAEEVGQNSVTRWLDKDGKPTTDPTKAFDGEVYDITTNSWQRLGADKIADAIYAIIEQTPGAKESLDQDYDVALWKHNKFARTSDEITVSDITDENGNILSRENYLAKRINDTARTSAYEKRVTNTTYGSGLSTYIKAKHTPTTGSGVRLDNQTFDILENAFRDDPVTFTYNKGEKAYELKANTIYQIKDTLSRFGISPETDSIDDLSYAIDLIPDTIDGKSTYDTKDILNNQLMLLEEAQFNLDTIRMNMSDSDREKYDFALGMLNGGKAIKDRSRYDNRVINTENNLFNNASRLEISFKTDTELNDFLKTFGKTTPLDQVGVEVKEKSITINREARNIIPLVASKANNYNRINTGWLGKIFGNKPTYDIVMLDENGNEVTNILNAGGENIPRNISKEQFIDLGDYYDKAQRFAAKYDDKYDITNKDITLSNLDIYGETHTEGYTSTMYNMGLMDLQEKKRIDTNALQSIDNALLNFDATQYDVYNADGKITDAKELQELKHEFRLALQQDRLAKTSSLVPGIIDKFTGLQGGYTITILPPKNDKGKEIGKTRQYYIPGLGQESHLQALNQNPTFNASNTLDVLNETLSTKYITTDRKTPILGSISITGIGNRNYICDFNGYKFPLNKRDGADLYVSIGNYHTIKNYIRTRNLDINNFLQSNEATRNSLNDIVEVLSNVTGYKKELIGDLLYNDIQN